MAAKEFTAPDWVFPGAQVVTTEVVRGYVCKAWLSTVDRVGKGWITLKDFGPRIAIDRLESANQSAGRYSSLVYRITERYTEEGQELLRNERIRRATGAVTGAFETWQKDPRDEKTRKDLRAALDRLDNVFESWD